MKYANEETRVGTSARAGPFAPLHGSGVTIALHCGADKTSHFPQSTFVYLSEVLSEAIGETELPRARAVTELAEVVTHASHHQYCPRNQRVPIFSSVLKSKHDKN